MTASMATPKAPRHDQSQIAGGRKEIFSRFEYQPQYPFISQLDTIDLNRFSRQYNIGGPLKFIAGRPYRYYKTEDSLWVYPWDFPQQINHKCFNRANRQCHQSINLVKKEEEKLSGLASQTPADVVHPSNCWQSVYQKCLV